MVRKLANFFDLSAKPETFSVILSWLRVVFSPKPSLSLKNLTSDEEGLSFFLAVLERTLKTSNKSTSCSIDFE